MTRSPDQQAMARRVLSAVNEYPDNFNMNDWMYSDEFDVLDPQEPNLCGTTMCVAGWAVHLAGYVMDSYNAWLPGDTEEPDPISWRAGKLLGLRSDEAMRLFHAPAWKAKLWLEGLAGDPDFVLTY